MDDPRLVEYDTGKYPFRQELENILGTRELEEIRADLELQQPGKDQATPFHKKYYAGNASFLALYRKFVSEYLGAGPELLYQRVPTFRIHLPGNLAVGAWHRDTEYGHNPAELNYWVPVTDARESSTIHFEKTGPVNLGYGQILVFHGDLLHGNLVNQTGKTRVSFDFRTLRRSEFVDSDARTLTGFTRFKIGEYWAE